MSLFSAPPPSQRWVFALTAIVTATAVPAHAQSAAPQANAQDAAAPITVEAEQITGRPDREVNLERNVELTRGQMRLTADTACYMQVEDEVAARGNVFMQRFGDRYTGDALQLNLSSGKGYVLNPTYKLQTNNAQGGAERLDFISRDEVVVSNATYSTCEGLNPDWYLKANTLRLDAGRDVGVASGTVVYFKDVPILGTPALSFSLSGARRSGWLPPSVGFGSKGAAEVMVPYYFNIAPNRDLTLYPRLMLDRGLQMGATGRYIGETGAGWYGGETHLEFLINDKEANTDRWLVNSNHSQTLARGLSFGWNIRAASDDEYPSDFSKSISTSAERQLLREVRTDYVSKYWTLTARAQNYQILQDPAAVTDPSLTVIRPYDRLPQINLNAGRYDINGFDYALSAELVRFSHPDFQTGNRAVAVPQVSYPFIRPGYFVTPKLIVHASKYDVDTVDGGSRSLTRTLPTFSLDSGLIYERDATLLGKAVTQTLEPRLFYVYTPYKDQSEFPLFDTAEAGFSFAQIFTENRFIGADRVADANQVTAAVTSRFIEENGSERLRVALGQRFYFRDQRVLLNPAQSRDDRRSDLLAAASGRIADDWSFDSAIQYDARASQTFSSNYGVQWRPGDKKVLNLEYRYLRDIFKNVDLSSQWPLSKRWYGVGRVSYSVKDHKVLESLLGLEYRADCWVFRTGAQRFVTTLQNTSTPIFFQLELNGLSKLGFGNPLESFYKSIPGYSRLNPGVGL